MVENRIGTDILTFALFLSSARLYPSRLRIILASPFPPKFSPSLSPVSYTHQPPHET
jgi:hypothetical protein